MAGSGVIAGGGSAAVAEKKRDAAADHKTRKAMTSLERKITKLQEREQGITAKMAEVATDMDALNELNTELAGVRDEIENPEMEWMEANTNNSHGLFYLLNSLESWYSGEDIFKILNIKSIFQELHNMVFSNFFEDFIDKHFVNAKYKSFTILYPDKKKMKEDEYSLSNESFRIVFSAMFEIIPANIAESVIGSTSHKK